ncbi:OmpA family protein [Marinivivus vitaminiproducens]|uniref:OmpA family protein n=1 Tax=Marinivivus vitaminiproducens TaxID=3035935 RepID=UPI0027A684FC|nr:OmpA family protein [Geminicoccaceae bacterium SCSIO 64248]
MSGSTGSELTPGGTAGSSLSAATPASPADLALTETEAGTVVTLQGDVLFDFDSADIRSDAEPTLARLADLIEESGTRRVEITGHTDSKGSDGYNQDLSERRAESVRRYLTTSLDLPRRLFRVDGRGESEPVAANTQPDGSDDPQGRQKNRRVELLLAQ